MKNEKLKYRTNETTLPTHPQRGCVRTSKEGSDAGGERQIFVYHLPTFLDPS